MRCRSGKARWGTTRRLGSAAAWPVVARAQQPSMPVIGYLSPQDDTSKYETVPFLRGLKETGYVEGQNVAVEYRYAENQLAQCVHWPSQHAISRFDPQSCRSSSGQRAYDKLRPAPGATKQASSFSI
jgi:hypothetical protein